MVARREGERKVFHRIALVVVLYGIAQVDGVGRIGQQGVAQLDGQCLGVARYGWSLHLRRRDGSRQEPYSKGLSLALVTSLIIIGGSGNTIVLWS